MGRAEKGVEREGEREGLMAEKLKLVRKRGGPCTPPPTWRLEFPSQKNMNGVKEFLNFSNSPVSARKLCAKLWEIQFQPHHLAPLANSSKSATRLRRHVHHRNDTVIEVPRQLVQPSDRPSPQVAPYNHAVTPISSLDFKGKIGEPSYNIKTSAELLKVLNCIWNLEERHASNVAVVKALKKELDLSRVQVKKLLQEKQTNRKEMDNLMKQIAEEKLVRKNNKHDRSKIAVQSTKEELEYERRLRKHLERLHRRRVRELSGVKSSLFGSLRDLERERKARILLENLCDEFAKGIRDYEQEVRSLVQNAEKGQANGDNSLDMPILHISEAWLDVRMQMKLAQADNDLSETNSVVEKLLFDIETFLHAEQFFDMKRRGNSSPKELKEIHPFRHSLDSFPLKEAVSAPQNMAEEASIDNTTEVHQEKKESHNSMRKQFNEETGLVKANMGKNMPCGDNESGFVDRKLSGIGGDKTALLNAPGVTTTQGPHESDRPWTQRVNSSHRLDNLVGNSSLSSEGDKIYPESICREDSCVHAVVTGSGSPVKQWKSKLTVPHFDKSESFKLPRGVKGNTLMAKLLEAKLEGQKSGFKAG